MNKNPKISCAIDTKVEGRETPRTTDIVVKIFKNRIFIVATDYKKIGGLVSVTRGESLKDFDTITYDATAIFGNSRPHVLAAAKYIAQSIEIDRPLLLALSTETHEKDFLDVIIAAIKKFKTW